MMGPLGVRIDLDHRAVRDRLGDVAVEPRDHGEIGERHALHHDRVDRLEHERRRHDAARLHLVQHPGRRDAALGGIEHQHAADVALAGELVLGPREHALDAVEIVARREAVLGDQRLALQLAAHAGAGVEDLGSSELASRAGRGRRTAPSTSAPAGSRSRRGCWSAWPNWWRAASSRSPPPSPARSSGRSTCRTAPCRRPLSIRAVRPMRSASGLTCGLVTASSGMVARRPSSSSATRCISTRLSCGAENTTRSTLSMALA